jgi:hypothetical protein
MSGDNKLFTHLPDTIEGFRDAQRKLIQSGAAEDPAVESDRILIYLMAELACQLAYVAETLERKT